VNFYFHLLNIEHSDLALVPEYDFGIDACRQAGREAAGEQGMKGSFLFGVQGGIDCLLYSVNPAWSEEASQVTSLNE